MRIICILFFGLMVLGCSQGKPTAEEVRKEIESVIQIGDSREKVEEELKKLGIPFDYDRHQNRYQASRKTTSKDNYHTVVIFLNLGDSNKFVESINIENVYTGL
ncbi:hypothetical protein G0Q06_05595 [Puniceicoccales bacterium CK1056]|uniref:Lipoprotein SmpA/OmlA domain-containing protein n=1 Tax=Oceanipulchritudo coccoides TaxID=2706888 RepID=A0A6B2M1G1_9BACT|nr:hypothetical protein [Oceanipulchritudo coccoides]NDV61917.1 hypothetical protein [Oceanipulchritudo coccoides]